MNSDKNFCFVDYRLNFISKNDFTNKNSCDIFSPKIAVKNLIF